MKTTCCSSVVEKKTATDVPAKSHCELSFAFVVVFKTVAVTLSLYLFVCALTLLSSSFRMLGGRNISGFFSNSEILSNPIVGLMIGVLVTVLVQSSATCTSIIVSMVSAGVEVRHAVPMIFGANIGTSVTNTLVSFGQVHDVECFQRAFAAATVHDMFNWLTVIVMMILEVSFGLLQRITHDIVQSMSIPDGTSIKSPDLLKPLTSPFTSKIVQLDKTILLGWAMDNRSFDNVTTLLRTNCGGGTSNEPCMFLLAMIGRAGVGDVALGIGLLLFSLILLSLCLVAVMKILNSIMGGHMTTVIKKVINSKVPYCPWLTGYLCMLIGAVITFLVRSSSIFTSTLTPLCGTGLISLETAYPMTLGSNIGTTTTSILASFAAEGQYLKPSIQIAMVHLFFNIFGILFFYPIPWMRWPIGMARCLGNLAGRYRWLAIAYLLGAFFFLPLSVFILSMAGSVFITATVIPICLLVFLVVVINQIQSSFPGVLPFWLRDWSHLPLWMRSLDPLDRLISRVCCYMDTTRSLGDNNNDTELKNATGVTYLEQTSPPTIMNVSSRTHLYSNCQDV